MVAAALAAACSSTATPGDKYPAQGDFCKALAVAECQEAQYCEVDATACETVRSQVCLGKATAALGQGRAYVPKAAPDCVDQATAAFAKNPITSDSLAFAEASLNPAADFVGKCEAVFAGSVDKNGQCTKDVQCSSGRVCDKGYCADKVTKAGNDPCANPGEVCDTGFYCTGSPMHCTAKLTTSQPCNATAPCVEADYCLAGTCAQRLAIGAACTGDGDCTSGFCDVYNGAVCGPSIVFAPAEKTLCAALTSATSGPPDAGPAPVGDAATD
jgi:hypothetical protein